MVSPSPVSKKTATANRHSASATVTKVISNAKDPIAAISKKTVLKKAASKKQALNHATKVVMMRPVQTVLTVTSVAPAVTAMVASNAARAKAVTRAAAAAVVVSAANAPSVRIVATVSTAP